MGRRDHCYFFGTNHLDVLTACNNDVKHIVLTFRENKKTRPRLPALAHFIICLPPEIPRDIASTPSILQRVQRWRVW